MWNQRSGNLVGGHQRLKVLIARGDTEVYVSVVDLPPEQEKTLNIALNQIRGDWDDEKLATLLEELTKTPEIDVTITGFDPPEIEELIARVLEPGSSDDDDSFDLERALDTDRPAVTQPRPWPRKKGGTLSSREAAQRTLVRPTSISAEPSANFW